MSNGLPIHVPLSVHGHTANVYIFVRFHGAEERARELGPLLQNMPPQQARVFDHYPIFVILHKPGGADSGGTWRPGHVHSVFRGRSVITGVPDADVERLVVEPGYGLIGIPQERWQRPMALAKFTIFHEIGHAVDYEMNLAQTGIDAEDYRGVRPVCGGSSLLHRRLAEAYARYIVRHPHICRDPVPGEEQAASDRRVVTNLRGSPAFRGVPASWHPGVRS